MEDKQLEKETWDYIKGLVLAPKSLLLSFVIATLALQVYLGVIPTVVTMFAFTENAFGRMMNGILKSLQQLEGNVAFLLISLFVAGVLLVYGLVMIIKIATKIVSAKDF